LPLKTMNRRIQWVYASFGSTTVVPHPNRHTHPIHQTRFREFLAMRDGMAGAQSQFPAAK
jgi:hypothetical protein